MPERTTEYEYDADGKLVRSREWVESAWDERQQALMLAYAEWEAARCPVCGGDPAECQDPLADKDNPRGKWVYWPKLPKVCHVGTAARLYNQKPDDKRALIPQVVKQRRGEPAPRLDW
ncbi:hypothetical protein [Phytohabitans houttuyneae]|uniref:Uncharacterized protein n=1 Tax=Phytohabitans houttuyneae TaxID=1076126 RepID=A0A6V8KFG8_9ACTN|nr:hypothetical protein [Phytohabitans houttuyneae]GFJ79475.1 hypothetical protein Phou_036550 [Phytohabitans houttuyneae]